LIGLGTAVDLGLLLAGIGIAVYRVRMRTSIK